MSKRGVHFHVNTIVGDLTIERVVTDDKSAYKAAERAFSELIPQSAPKFMLTVWECPDKRCECTDIQELH